jgi:plastocyanin
MTMRAPLLALALLLAAAAPAMAADATVQVGDDFFDPDSVRVEPGDTVTWDWIGTNDHNVRASARQTERFRSRIQAGADKSFRRTFTNRGRFRYFCEVHPDLMRATVQVGDAETTDPRVRRLRARVSGSRARISFRLSERSFVTLRLRGAERKTVRKIFRRGRRSVTLRGLEDGRYRVSVSAKDGFGNKSRTARKRFGVG